MMMMSSSSSSSSSSGNYTKSVKTKIGKKLKGSENGVVNREKIIALEQDVEKLRKKLRLEENIHRAMERAFNRPLGALPRLPPFLPPSILELLAEVAVLEEEMVRLEEQIVHCRQELYQEAAFTSPSAGFPKHWQSRSHMLEKIKSASSNGRESDSPLFRKPLSVSECRTGKENNLSANSTIKTPGKKMPIAHTQFNKSLEAQKLQKESLRGRNTNAEQRSYGGADDPNTISEDLVKCLSNIFMRMSSVKRLTVSEAQENDKASVFRDPYRICSSFRTRDIGPYKNFSDVEAASVNQKRTLPSSSLFLIRQLKCLLGRLASVNLKKLNQQEKLAFWINIYNSCMMNGFLEHGIPESSEMMVTLMRKAAINVGGHFLNAITIEHFILRLPYKSKYISKKGSKKIEMAARSKFGLEFSEPLVTFALSCGSWSSPAVRIYTAYKVEEELEVAKREYLEASLGISEEKMGIPKLMDWYSHDFAKDIESLLDWICLQLPNELRKDALSCIQQGMSKSSSTTLPHHIIPYDFTFRYLFSI